eukprot:2383521-Pyramimonas_sp.AAC.1
MFADIRQRIQGESFMPLGVSDLREALKSMKPNAAMGVDRVGSHDYDRLPDAAIDELGEILALCELHQVWPHQVLLTLGTLLPKKLS